MLLPEQLRRRRGEPAASGVVDGLLRAAARRGREVAVRDAGRRLGRLLAAARPTQSLGEAAPVEDRAGRPRRSRARAGCAGRHRDRLPRRVGCRRRSRTGPPRALSSDRRPWSRSARSVRAARDRLGAGRHQLAVLAGGGATSCATGEPRTLIRRPSGATLACSPLPNSGTPLGVLHPGQVVDAGDVDVVALQAGSRARSAARQTEGPQVGRGRSRARSSLAGLRARAGEEAVEPGDLARCPGEAVDVDDALPARAARSCRAAPLPLAITACRASALRCAGVDPARTSKLARCSRAPTAPLFTASLVG